MAQVINTNIASLNAQRNLSTSQTATNTALQRLSTGLRINSAKDDAAGLAISERMSTQITGLNQAVRNSNDGISLAQTAEGALSQIGTNLQRIRELAVQSRNASNSTDDRAALQKEVTQLRSEIGRVAKDTSFNGTNLIDGSFNAQAFQVGANQGQTISIAGIANANVSELGEWTSATKPAGTVGNAAALGANNTQVSIKGIAAGEFTIDGKNVVVDAVSGEADVDTARTAFAAKVQTAITDLGAAYADVTVTADNATGKLVLTNGAAADPAIEIGGTSSPFAVGSVAGAASPAASEITTKTSFKAISETAAFKINGVSITVGSADTASARAKDLATAINKESSTTNVTASVVDGKLKLNSEKNFTVSTDDATALAANTGIAVDASGSQVFAVTEGTKQTGFASGDISTVEGADDMILAMDAALKSVNESRADLGAIQNRFSSVVSSLQTTSENLSASRSRILDTDFAAETASLTRAQILQQAGTAMLAQANSLPNNVMSLLRG